MMFFLIFIILLIFELCYFRIADKFGIIDKPNQRSSHAEITLRGGGIIFYLGILFYTIFYHFSYPYFFIGLSLVCLVSFIDDIKSLSFKVRFPVHIFAMFLMFYQCGFLNYAWWYIILALVLCVGIINAYNFMDGINGMTGGYSLVLALTLLYINQKIVWFIDSTFLYVVILSLIVFNIFNFRIKAKCFAGDIGSIGIAFILVFVLGLLILKTNNLYWIILLAVYGVDSILTIIRRLILYENIFQPHRKHLYQFLANEMKFSHLKVSFFYMSLQIATNLFFLSSGCGAISFTVVMVVLIACYLFFINKMKQKINIRKQCE